MRTGLVITALVAVSLVLALGSWYFDLGHDYVEKVPGLHGRSMEEVRARFGPPDWERSFSMGDPLGEFYVELYNMYPPDDPNTKNVRITEWRWVYRRYNVAVLFQEVEGRWIVVSTCRWYHSVHF